MRPSLHKVGKGMEQICPVDQRSEKFMGLSVL
jgi:hypothetical protein